MPVIELFTMIRAPRERIFDLSRSIDLHLESASDTGERAVAGVTSGLIGLGESVTWSARHFGVRQRMTVRISEYHPPTHFQDVIVKGVFARFVHDHFFEEREDGTLMIDRLDFAAPLGPLGRLAERLVLTRYMTRFLELRNETIRRIAESDRWRNLLPDPSVTGGEA